MYVDGGVGTYGNPCYLATVEATEYFTGLVKPGYTLKDDDARYIHDNVIHLSFGTGATPTHFYGEETIQKKKIWDWIGYTLFETMEDVNETQLGVTRRRFAGGNNYYPDWQGQPYYNQKLDFRRYQVVLDAKRLEAPVDTPDPRDAGLGMTLTAEEKELLKNGLMMNANTDDELALIDAYWRHGCHRPR